MLARNLKLVRGMQKNKDLWFSGETKVNLIEAVFRSQATERDKTR